MRYTSEAHQTTTLYGQHPQTMNDEVTLDRWHKMSDRGAKAMAEMFKEAAKTDVQVSWLRPQTQKLTGEQRHILSGVQNTTLDELTRNLKDLQPYTVEEVMPSWDGNGYENQKHFSGKLHLPDLGRAINPQGSSYNALRLNRDSFSEVANHKHKLGYLTSMFSFRYADYMLFNHNTMIDIEYDTVTFRSAKPTSDAAKEEPGNSSAPRNDANTKRTRMDPRCQVDNAPWRMAKKVKSESDEHE